MAAARLGVRRFLYTLLDEVHQPEGHVLRCALGVYKDVTYNILNFPRFVQQNAETQIIKFT